MKRRRRKNHYPIYKIEYNKETCFISMFGNFIFNLVKAIILSLLLISLGAIVLSEMELLQEDLKDCKTVIEKNKTCYCFK